MIREPENNYYQKKAFVPGFLSLIRPNFSFTSSVVCFFAHKLQTPLTVTRKSKLLGYKPNTTP